MKFNGLGPLGGQRKGENPEATSRRQTFPCSPAAEGAVGDQGAARCADGRICQKKTLGQSCPPILLPPPSPGLCSVHCNGQFKFSPPKNQVEPGIRKEKKYIYVRWRFLFVIGALPPWPPSLLMNKRKVRTYQISFAAASSTFAQLTQRTIAPSHSPVTPCRRRPQAPKPERHLLPSPSVPGAGA